MKNSRLKTTATNVPQSMTEANIVLGDIGTLQRSIDLIDLAEVEQISLVKAEFEKERAPLNAEIKQRFFDLSAWAEANKDELLNGKKRQVRMPQGVIGWRWGNPKVSVSKASLKGVIRALKKFDLTNLLRATIDVDKAAILKDPSQIDGIEGLKVTQIESFFAQPLDIETEQVKTVQRLSGSDVITAPDPANENAGG